MISSDLGNKLFGKWVYAKTYNDLRENIRKAHISRNVHGYVCSSLFYALIISLISLFCGFIIAGHLTKNYFLIFLITAISGLVSGYFTYGLLIYFPSFMATNRAYGIDQSLNHTVTYLYALSRGGMNILDMFKSLSSYTHIYGGTAEEISLIVRDMDFFGMDIVTALNNASQRTPSKKFKDFIDNLISVINSGGDLSGFFKSRSEFYQDTSAQDQKSFLETLGVFAEVYVSVLVAAPLFLIVIIVVMGLLQGGVELYLSIIIYAVIPIGTLLFLVLVDTISGISEEMPVIYTSIKRLEIYKDAPQLQVEGLYLFSWDEVTEKDGARLLEILEQNLNIDVGDYAKIETLDDGSAIKISSEKNNILFRLNYEKTGVTLITNGIKTDEFIARTENGKLKIYERLYESADINRLEWYEKRSKIKKFLLHPFKIFFDNPEKTFLITIPISIIYLYFSIKDSALTFQSLKTIDNYFLMAILLIITPYAIFFEIRKRKLRTLEERMPDFLKQLAGMNEAGLTLTQAIAYTAESNLGVLTYEIKKIHRAIEWGTITIDALLKFEKRIESSAISRVITLIAKASESTSDIRGVLSIAAKDTDIGQRLKMERFSSLLIYVMIIYLSFFVFLFIIVVLLVYFLAKMPSGSDAAMFKTSSLANIKTLFYHASLLQAFFSGLIAGQMGEGNWRGGLKHSILMLVIAYVVFAFFLQGVGR